jgi:Fe-S oxidoreductase/nitrate reductase gamma subunit
MQPTREIYWNIDGHYFLYLLLGISAMLFAIGFSKHLRVWRRGLPDNRWDAPFQRLVYTAKQVFLHSRLRRYRLAGVFHAMLFGGFFILFLGTVAVLLDADFGLRILKGAFYLYFQSLFLDIAGLVAISGVIVSLIHRYIIRPERYDATRSYLITSGILLFILVGGFFIEGIRIRLTHDPWAGWSPVGAWIGGYFDHTSEGALSILHRILWWLHLSAVLALFAYLPYSRLMHTLLGPVNIFLRNRNRGVLKPARYGVSNFEDLESCGVGTFEEFTWKHIFDFYACTECGRCTDNCPAYAAGRPLSPKKLTLDLRDHGYKKQSDFKKKNNEPPVSLSEEVIDQQALWSCTTCGACEAECPVFIEYIDKIVDMRRHLVENSKNPASFNKVFQHFEITGNPFGKPPEKRIEWLGNLKDIPVKILSDGDETDVLFYVDSYCSYDPQSQAIAANIAKGLYRAGIDFGILGEMETDTGHQVRRMGEEGLFQFLKERNMEALKKIKFKRFVTADPHAFNTLKNDYPGEMQVQHYTEFFSDLMMGGKYRPAVTVSEEFVYTYHDPCYLGRHNGIYDAPRQLLQSISGMKFVEMKKSRDRSFCCGGGDIILWHEIEKEKKRPAELRIQMALEAGASIIVTACPFCFIHFEDAIKTMGLENEMKIMDLMTLLITGNERRTDK